MASVFGRNKPYNRRKPQSKTDYSPTVSAAGTPHPTTSRGPMKEARIIIPSWGEVYAQKLISITLPALLAPGNLPALRTMFDVEIVLVTESRLFDSIRSSKSFQFVSGLCRTRLVSLDDLMTDVPGDYGVVLTYALFRGFTDLGTKMTEIYLL